MTGSSLMELATRKQMADGQLFEVARRTFDTPHFRGIEFIEVESKSILNKVAGNYLPFNWSINVFRGCSHACTFCFARATHTYLDFDAGRDFETKILVKVNAPQLLRKELRAKRWKGESIAMGTNTDPYQRAEGKYKLTRGVLETLVEFRNPFSILTKGTLILRDLDLIATAARQVDVSTAFSIPTLDDDVWRKSEPGTPHPRRRLDAVAKLTEAGISCGVLMAPVLPGISDSPKQLREVMEAALGAGATFVSPILLHLRPYVREVYMEWLKDNYPQLVGQYEQMYTRTYAPKPERDALARRASEIRSELPPSRGRERARPPEKRARAAAMAARAQQLRLI